MTYDKLCDNVEDDGTADGALKAMAELIKPIPPKPPRKSWLARWLRPWAGAGKGRGW